MDTMPWCAANRWIAPTAEAQLHQKGLSSWALSRGNCQLRAVRALGRSAECSRSQHRTSAQHRGTRGLAAASLDRVGQTISSFVGFRTLRRSLVGRCRHAVAKGTIERWLTVDMATASSLSCWEFRSSLSSPPTFLPKPFSSPSSHLMEALRLQVPFSCCEASALTNASPCPRSHLCLLRLVHRRCPVAGAPVRHWTVHEYVACSHCARSHGHVRRYLQSFQRAAMFCSWRPARCRRSSRS